MIFPGLAIFFSVMAFNLLGDGLRDALDPQGLNRKHSKINDLKLNFCHEHK